MTKIIDNTNLGYLISKIKAAFWSKSETTEVSIDDTPTSGSNNLVKSGGVYTAVNAKYTKPSTGIPASDIASGVIPDAVEANPTVPSGTTPTSLTGVKVGSSYYSIDGAVNDVTVGGSSVVNNNGVAVIPSIPSAPGTLNTNNSDAQTASSSEALSGTIKLHKVSKTGSYNDLLNKPTIPTVPTISTNISTDADDDTKTASPKAVKTYVDNAVPDVTGKADKVTSATNGNLAGLDSNGNLTDSGMGIDNIPTANSNNVVKSGGIYNAIMHPQLAYKLFDNPFSSTSTWTVHCFMNMRASAWSKIYTIRFRIKAWIPNVSNSTAISDVTLQVYRGVVKAYYIKNAIANTDYKPYYDLYFYGATETGYNAGASDFVGIRINSSAYSYTTQRNYEIQVINADECTFSIFDNDKNSTAAKGEYSASVNYNSGTQFNTYTNGLQETGDTNTTYSIISNDELRTGTATSSRTVSAARLAANYNISTDSDTGVSTIRIGANTISPEVVSNKVTSLSSSSTDTEYPSAKCVYDALPNIVNIEWPEYDAKSDYLTFEVLRANTKIYWKLRHSNSVAKTIEISSMSGTWTSYTASNDNDGKGTLIYTTIDNYTRILIRGANSSYGDNGYGCCFYFDNYCYVYGNIMSLCNKTDFSSLTSVSNYGFTYLFYNNEFLLSHPYKRLVLPATTLGDYAYGYMFMGCTNLVITPDLPEYTASGSYSWSVWSNIFDNCPRIRYSKCLDPKNNSLPGYSTTVSKRDKFLILNDSKANMTISSASNFHDIFLTESKEPDWLRNYIGLTAFYDFVGEDQPDWNETRTISKAYIKNKPTIPAAQIQSDWNQTTNTALDYIKNKPQLNWPEYDAKNNYLTFEALYDNTIVYFGTTKYSSDTELPSEHQKTIEVSKDGVTWTQVTSSLREFSILRRTITINNSKGTIAATLNAKEKLYVRGDNNFYFEDGGIYDKYSTGFLFSAPCFVYGNIMSLCSSTSFSNLTTLSANYTFSELFANNYYTLLAHPYKKLVLPATSLSTYCYRDMFLSCYSLTVAPEFPENVNIEYGVFGDCRNLKYLNATFATYTSQIPVLFDYDSMGHYQSTVPSCIVIVNTDDWSRSNGDDSAVDRCIFIDSDKEPDGLRNYIACETFYNKNDTCYNEEITSLIRPNIVVDFGTLTANLSRATFLFCEIGDKFIANNYYWVFNTPSRNYTIVWPAEITSWYGDEGAPVIRANKHYEISVLNGVGMWIETDIPT